MTRVERRAVDDIDAAWDDLWRFRGVPVKAVAVDTTRARRRATMADLMVGMQRSSCGLWMMARSRGRGKKKVRRVVECVSEARTDRRLSFCLAFLQSTQDPVRRSILFFFTVFSS
jgi:hypothetical protein